MNKTDLIVIALAGAAVYMVVQATKTKTAAPASPGVMGTVLGVPWEQTWRAFADVPVSDQFGYMTSGVPVWGGNAFTDLSQYTFSGP